MEQMIVENVQTLVEHAARTNDTSRRMSLVDLGKRLLEMSKRGDTDAVRALMSNGAPFTTDWLGTSPLHFSAQHGHQETAQVLLRAGISRDARTKVDRTPLHVACQEGHVAIVQLLLQSNADIDAKDMLKMTPLHWATEKGHIPIIGILIRNGADITLEDKFSRTPIDIALANGRTDIAQLFQIHEHTTGVIEEGDTITIETPENLVTETVCTSDGVDGLVIDTDKLIKSEPDDSTDQTSTSVLATLAALAEATAPNSGSAATTSEAMSWLESHGITMISGDGSLITSAVESGQTITLTEAGKIALNQIIQQENSVVETDGEIQEETIIEQADGDAAQNMITLVTSGDGADGIGDHHQVQGTIVTTEDGTEILVQNAQGDVISHMTDEDGNALVIEEANASLAGVGKAASIEEEMVLQEAGEAEQLTLEETLGGDEGQLTLPEHLETVEEHVTGETTLEVEGEVKVDDEVEEEVVGDE